MVRGSVVGVVAGLVLGMAHVAAADEATLKKGIQVFTDQKCQICHSIAGKGNKNGSLDDVGSRLSSDDIRHWIVNAKEMIEKTKAPRKPAMKMYSLPKEDVDALVAYLETLKKKS